MEPFLLIVHKEPSVRTCGWPRVGTVSLWQDELQVATGPVPFHQLPTEDSRGTGLYRAQGSV